jgi:ElaB/YqjD/DUF883 family membrane-anchored ribosome-binding protein
MSATIQTSGSNAKTGVTPGAHNAAVNASTPTAATTSMENRSREENKSTAEDLREKAGEALDNTASRVSEAAAGARDTVEQGYRDAKDAAGAAYERAAETVDQGVRTARAGAESAYREAEYRGRRAGAEVSRYVNDHPLMVGVLGFAGGLLIGALLPIGKRGNNGGNGHSYRDSSGQGDYPYRRGGDRHPASYSYPERNHDERPYAG